ncbi:MAG: endonuclease [Bacilli bacterium]|nr:endonuclease [Bacilli bacterium]
MKIKYSLPLLLLVTAMPVASGTLAYRPALEAYAATSVSQYEIAKLPTTIDLNPVADSDVRSYYSALDGKNLQGDDLLKALKPILKNGQKYNSYDSGSNVWKAYEITDRDWTLSPAKNITNGTYNEATNTITNYKYGSMSNKLDNPYNHLLYRNPGVEQGYQRAWDQHGNNNGTDREHIWPKSRGFGKDGSEEHQFPGARGDLHHLLPGDSYVNSALHSNNPYGFVDPAKRSKNAGEEYKISDVIVVAGNYLGAPASEGISNPNDVSVFEPQDCDKGDIARACFYMVARYNNLSGDDETIDAGNPNLILDDTLSTETEMSTATKAVSIGLIRDLLVWNKIDPVDDYEAHRNDIIYRNFDGNRNPFIDFPQWADAIWGTSTYDANARKVTAYNSAPKGTASPSSDELHQGGSVTPAPSHSSEPSGSTSEPAGNTSVPNGNTSEPAGNTSEPGGSTPSGQMDFKLPIWVYFAGAAVVVVILLVLIIVALKGKGKSRKAARKILKNAVKGKGSSKSKKRK